MDDLDPLRSAHDLIPPPSPASIDAARGRLAQAIAAGERNGRRLNARTDLLRFRLPMLASLSAAIALLAIALWPGDGSTPGRPSSALAASLCLDSGPGPAGACLNALGDLALADDVLAGGKVFYRRDRSVYSTEYVGAGGQPQLSPADGGGFALVRASVEELWVAPDRSGRITYEPFDGPYLPSAADERAWQAAGRPNLDRLAGGVDPRDNLPPRVFGPGELDEVLLGAGGLDQALPEGNPVRDLPTEPEALGQVLRQVAWVQRVRLAGEGPCAADLGDCLPRTRQSIEDRFGANITTLLRYPFASPELRRALLRLFGDLRGARRLGGVRDPAGRRGVGIQIPGSYNNGLNVVVFDLATGRLLADGRMSDGTPDTLRWHGVYDVEVGGVERVGQRPHSATG